MFHNPLENLSLAFDAQIEDLLQWIAHTESLHPDAIRSHAAYRMIVASIQWKLSENQSDAQAFQFRVGIIEFPSSPQKLNQPTTSPLSTHSMKSAQSPMTQQELSAHWVDSLYSDSIVIGETLP